MDNKNTTPEYNIESFKLNYRACIPFYVLLDKRLSGNEKVLYGIIEQMESSMTDVFINDRSLCHILGVSFESRILGKMQKKLKDFGYIKREEREITVNNNTFTASCWNTVKKSMMDNNISPPVPEVPTPPVPEVPTPPVPEVPTYNTHDLNTQDLKEKQSADAPVFFEKEYIAVWDELAMGQPFSPVRTKNKKQMKAIETNLKKIAKYWPELNKDAEYQLSPDIMLTPDNWKRFLIELIKKKWFMLCGDNPHSMDIILRRSNFEKAILIIKKQQKDNT